jgi:putative NIF3 family GTP cyclohydrolase 1 type 2
MNEGVDAFITGEIQLPNWYEANENNFHFFACGHHATEQYGIKALAQHLQNKFKLKNEQIIFISSQNPT